MRVKLDEPRCVASGQCTMIAPGVFDQRDSDGVAVVLDATPGPSLHEAVREAAAMCPAAAILLAEE